MWYGEVRGEKMAYSIPRGAGSHTLTQISYKDSILASFRNIFPSQFSKVFSSLGPCKVPDRFIVVNCCVWLSGHLLLIERHPMQIYVQFCHHHRGWKLNMMKNVCSMCPFVFCGGYYIRCWHPEAHQELYYPALLSLPLFLRKALTRFCLNKLPHIKYQMTVAPNAAAFRLGCISWRARSSLSRSMSSVL